MARRSLCRKFEVDHYIACRRNLLLNKMNTEVAVWALFLCGSLNGAFGQQFVGNDYEFENLIQSQDGSSDWVWRSNAESLKTLRLDQPGRQIVTLTLCARPAAPSESVVAYIDNMRYSNDGPSDTVTASVNGVEIGSFTTVPIWACGNHWNVFYETGKVGESFTMLEGEYQLKIKAQTDEYGVEFDKISIKTLNQQPGVDIVCNATLGGERK